MVWESIVIHELAVFYVYEVNRSFEMVFDKNCSNLVEFETRMNQKKKTEKRRLKINWWGKTVNVTFWKTN